MPNEPKNPPNPPEVLFKSIMKASSNQKGAEGGGDPANEPTKEKRPKRIVRILEEINLKNDQLTTVKCDNKTKHTAATSTPTGLRRRPLKLPQNVSIISKT